MILNRNEKIFIAGGTGMVGSSIKKFLIKKLYSNDGYRENLLCPNRKELDLLDFEAVKSWFSIIKPETLIIAAARVGGILANSSKPYEFISENLRIESNLIEAS